MCENLYKKSKDNGKSPILRTQINKLKKDIKKRSKEIEEERAEKERLENKKELLKIGKEGRELAEIESQQELDNQIMMIK